MRRDVPRRLFGGTIAAMVLAVPVLSLSTLARSANEERMPSRRGDRCTVCGKRIDESGLSILYRGRRVPLADEEMLGLFLDEPERHFLKLQPRGALFQEDSIPQARMRPGWLALGVWVLASIVTGALSSGVALRKGLPAARWYAVGFVANVIGLLLALRQRPAARVELPARLGKVPATASPVACPACGAENHPCARSCSRCGGRMEPKTASDMDRLGPC